MTIRPFSITVTQIFIILNALVWLGFGTIIALNAHPALPDLPLLKGIMAVLAFATAGVYLWLSVFLVNRNKITYFFVMGLLIILSLLTIIDQFGWADLVFLVINIVPIILLIKDRSWYLKSRSTIP